MYWPCVSFCPRGCPPGVTVPEYTYAYRFMYMYVVCVHVLVHLHTLTCRYISYIHMYTYFYIYKPSTERIACSSGAPCFRYASLSRTHSLSHTLSGRHCSASEAVPFIPSCPCPLAWTPGPARMEHYSSLLSYRVYYRVSHVVLGGLSVMSMLQFHRT